MAPSRARWARRAPVRLTLRWVTAALLAACVDGPTSPGRFGELRIRPSYATGDAPTALGFSVDSAKVRIARPSESTPIVDTMVAYRSDTASLGWILNLREDEETLRVDVTIWDDGARVYSGDGLILVRERATAAAATDPIPVAYVGPAIVATVTVSPESVTLDAFAASGALAAEARDRHGNVVESTFSWTSDEPAIATVDPVSGVVTAVGNGTTTVHAATGATRGTVTIVVAQRVAAIAVTPATTAFASLGATQPLSAAAFDPNGHAVTGATITWTSSNSAVASVDPATGVVTSVAGGSATIAAKSGAVEGTALVTVNPTADVASIVVAPTGVTLTAVGATRQFTAEARDAGGQVLTGVQFRWASTAGAVATIDELTGVARAAGHGVTTLTATAGAIVGSAGVKVDLGATIATVVVLPGSATLTAVGSTQQFTAEARDASGVTVPGISFEWTSTVVAVGNVAPNTGVATAASHGATVIVASANGVTGTATLSVNLNASIATVSVSPSTTAMTGLGVTQQFTAEARDANGTVLPGVPFAWNSSAPDVATVDPVTGLASATGQGTTTISAAASGVTGTATLTVNLTSLIATVVVSPEAGTLTAVGATQQFMAEARDAAGNKLPGVAFAWTSGVPAVATIAGNTGLATAAAHGTTTIAASANGVIGTATLAVNLTETIATVVVSPGTTTLTALGATRQFTAEAHDGSGTPVPGVPFAWSTSSPAVATVNTSSGLATATGHGSATIIATAGLVQGSATLTVDLTETVASIVVSPSAPTLTTVGATVAFSAEARNANGDALPGISFEWTSAVPAVASVEAASGLATAAAHGSTTIAARANGVTGTATLTVNLSASIASVVVSPPAVTLTARGATQQFIAEARDAGGAVVPVAAFTWSSSTPEVASVDAAGGLATAAGHGSTTITATMNGVSGSALLSVDLSTTVTSVVVTPVDVELTALGATRQYTAVARDANGVAVPVSFTWSSSAPGIATVDAAGIATAVANGATTVMAAVGSVSGTAALTVAQRVSRVDVTPASATIAGILATLQLTARALDANDNVVSGLIFEWSSSDAHVAIVDANGLVTSKGVGTASIRAATAGVTGSAAVVIQ